MKNNNDSLISAMRYNIEEKEKYIRVLEEELYRLKSIFGECRETILTRKSPVIKKYIFKELKEE